MFFKSAGAERVEKEWLEGFYSFRDQTSLGPVGADAIAINDEQIILEFEINDACRQPMGLLHGGVSLMMAESAASFHSAWFCDLSKEAPVGIEINGTHLSSKTEGKVRVVGTVIRKARSFVFHDVDIIDVDRDRILTRSRVTNYLKPFDR